MIIIQTKGTVANGEVKITVTPEFNNGEVDITAVFISVEHSRDVPWNVPTGF